MIEGIYRDTKRCSVIAHQFPAAAQSRVTALPPRHTAGELALPVFVTCFYRQKLATTICFLLQIRDAPPNQAGSRGTISPVPRALARSKLGEGAGTPQVYTG